MRTCHFPFAAVAGAVTTLLVTGCTQPQMRVRPWSYEPNHVRVAVGITRLEHGEACDPDLRWELQHTIARAFEHLGFTEVRDTTSEHDVDVDAKVLLDKSCGSGYVALYFLKGGKLDSSEEFAFGRQWSTGPEGLTTRGVERVLKASLRMKRLAGQVPDGPLVSPPPQ